MYRCACQPTTIDDCKLCGCLILSAQAAAAASG
jgi:hypothetical protein